MIADCKFRDCEPMTGLNSMPQILENEREGSANAVGRMAFLTRQSESGTTHKIDETIAFMVQHVNQPLQVSTLAAMASISPSHFFALFKRHTGRAPMDYFTRLRMERARRLLDTTSSSVKEVAAALGYEDPFYFSRVFKLVHRVAPTGYRAQQEKAGNRNLKRKYSNEKTPVTCLPPQLPVALPACEDGAGENLSRGRFQSSTNYPDSFHSNHAEPLSRPSQSGPAPVHP
jgi:AraC-like DNA-binding protein